eukprot:CAMPEP_0205805266 /NCGR_PEP_ID=MMETSP0205-20121125/8441_1 /ASSEMBLY_ACC=CAM_ASM_000278 /TAXON_ID=36767 /ORGANISM="Euplotes focardii, Strain TN1" /LENGTH=63 /DNA_ID=CAMNT_0053076215 /DNA_START=384 /DNA_END=572 /DNA_ORIENTATION=-
MNAYNNSLEEVKSEHYQGAEEDKIDIMGMECILSGLIYKGYIKGYISHEKGLMVVAKKDPFPE